MGRCIVVKWGKYEDMRNKREAKGKGDLGLSNE